MSRYAIDVAILPPPPVMDLAIAWNRKLSLLAKQSIGLNKTDVLPHISLLMGCVTDHNLPAAMSALQRIVQNTSSMILKVTAHRFTEDSHPVAALDILTTAPLLALQQSLIEGLGSLIRYDTVQEDLYDAPSESMSALKWINSFISEQVGLKFWPHITLGHGTTGDKQEMFTFTPDRLAICHLGKHCTCRKVLAVF